MWPLPKYSAPASEIINIYTYPKKSIPCII